MESRSTNLPSLRGPVRAHAIFDSWTEKNIITTLCSICRALVPEIATFTKRRFLHHDSLASLEHNASAGCPFCLLCFAAIERDPGGYLEQGLPESPKNPHGTQLWLHNLLEEQVLSGVGLGITAGECAGVRTVRAMGSGFVTLSCAMSGCISLLAEPADPPAKWVTGRFRSEATQWLSPNALTFIQQSLQLCVGDHQLCGRVSAHFMPSRLIEIGYEGRASRLIVHPTDVEPYAALSYSWGGSHGLKLTQDNLADLQVSFNDLELNKTCQQALEVARRLDLHYIWIDALCIVQGNKDDWAEESLLMAQIYGNAHITLLANQGQSSQDGLSGSSESVLRFPYVPIRFSHPLDADADGVVYADICRNVDGGPADSRAWCLQERMLSTRLIVFGPEQSVFHCQEAFITEQGDHSVRLVETGSILRIHQSEEFEGLGQLILLTFWYNVVQEYMTRQMTDPHDVFAALSSLARVVQTGNLGTYLAGLWANDLLRGLLWFANTPITRNYRRGKSARPTIAISSGRQVVTRAPSWSWAALEGPVHYCLCRTAEHNRMYQDQTRWRIFPVHRNPDRWTLQEDLDATQLFMPKGKLEIRASLKMVARSWVPASTFVTSLGNITGGAFGCARSLHLLSAATKCDSDDIVAVGAFDLAEELIGDLYCMQVMDFTGIEPPPAVDGLLLMKQRKDEGYKRVGAFQVLSKEFFDDRSDERAIDLV